MTLVIVEYLEPTTNTAACLVLAKEEQEDLAQYMDGWNKQLRKRRADAFRWARLTEKREDHHGWRLEYWDRIDRSFPA